MRERDIVRQEQIFHLITINLIIFFFVSNVELTGKLVDLTELLVLMSHTYRNVFERGRIYAGFSFWVGNWVKQGFEI